MTDIKLIAKQMIMNFKQMVSNYTSILFILFFVAVALLVPIIFIPLEMGAAISFGMLLIIVNSVLFANLHFIVRSSTLKMNMSLSKANRYTFNLSIVFTMIIVSILASTLLFTLIEIFNELGLILGAWMQNGDIPSSWGGSWHYKLTFDLYLFVIYYTLIMTILIYSISFMLTYLTSDKKVYFAIMLSLLILTVIFGGAFNRYYYMMNEAVMLDNPLFPKSMYWFSAIFPFYGPGELINDAFSVHKVNVETGVWFWPGAAEYWESNYTIFQMLISKNEWRWTLLMFTPYIEIVGFTSIGVGLSLINRYKK